MLLSIKNMKRTATFRRGHEMYEEVKTNCTQRVNYSNKFNEVHSKKNGTEASNQLLGIFPALIDGHCRVAAPIIVADMPILTHHCITNV